MLENANSEYRMKIITLERELESFRAAADPKNPLGTHNKKALPRVARQPSVSKRETLPNVSGDSSFFVDISEWNKEN